MLYARSEVGEKVLPKKHGRAFCPLCNGIVIAKCGEIYPHHWAHQSIRDCDEWYETESAWHLRWKSVFPKENIEVAITKNDKRHRADIVSREGTVIELQHSPISIAMIRERELFYEDMFWVFDMAHAKHAFRRLAASSATVVSFKWSHPRWSLIACQKPFYFDYGTKKMLCVTKLASTGFGTGYYVDRDDFILEHGGLPQSTT